MSVGPLLAAILESVSGRDADVDLILPFMPAGGIIYNHITAPGFVMAVLWFLQLLALLVFFREPIRINGSNADSTDTGEDWDSDEGNQRLVPIASSDSTKAYGSLPTDEEIETRQVSNGSRGVWQEIVLTGRLIFKNPGLPVTLLIFGFIELADEVLISSCSIVVRRYFGWHGSVAGFLIASLGALVLPAHFVVEKASRYYSERKIMMVS
jgi:hypothetical protein